MLKEIQYYIKGLYCSADEDIIWFQKISKQCSMELVPYYRDHLYQVTLAYIYTLRSGVKLICMPKELEDQEEYIRAGYPDSILFFE